jgi:hypothetical protein
MSNPNIAVAPQELVKRFAAETAHLSEANKLLAWPSVFQEMSWSADDIDREGFDGEITPNSLTEKALATLICEQDVVQPHLWIHTVAKTPEGEMDGFRIDTDDPALVALKHLQDADLLVDLEVGDLSLDANIKNLGRITAFRAIEKPKTHFSQPDEIGYIRGEVVRVVQATDPDYVVTLAEVQLDDKNLVSIVDEHPLDYQPLRYKGYENIPAREAVPQTGDIISGQADSFNPFYSSLRLPKANLLYRSSR